MRTFALLAVATAISFSSPFSGSSTPVDESMTEMPEDDEQVAVGEYKLTPEKKLKIIKEAYDEKGCKNMRDQMQVKADNIKEMDAGNRELNNMAREEDKRWLRDLFIYKVCLEKFNIKVYE